MDILPPEQWLAAHQGNDFILDEPFVILKIQSVISTHSYMTLAIYKQFIRWGFKSFCLILGLLCAIVIDN